MEADTRSSSTGRWVAMLLGNYDGRLGRDTWRVVDQFESTYFNGLDIRIYFNQVRIDDVVGLNYEIREQVLPIYGYASYTVDRYLRGQRIIEGTFTIFFKQPFELIHRIRSLRSTLKPEPSSGTATENAVSQEPPWRGAQASNQPIASSMVDILNYVIESQAKYWRPSVQDPIPGSDDLKNLRIDRKFTPLWATRDLQIRIAYGDYESRDKRLQQIQAQTTMMTLHPPKGPSGSDIYSLIEVLDHVQITSVGKAIDDSGRAVLEAYGFVASDIRVLY